MADLVLVGAGAFAREVYDWFADDLKARGDRFVGFLEDEVQSESGALGGLPRIGGISPDAIDPAWRLVMAVSAPNLKKLFADRFSDPQRFETLIHRTSVVSASARIGHGAIFGPMSLASAGSSTGDFATVNVHSSVGHDVDLGAYSTLSSYVDLTGYVVVGEGTFWGSGARAIPKVRIGARATIGAGSVVVRDVAESVTMFAAPARRL